MGTLDYSVEDRTAIIVFDNPSSGLLTGSMAQALEVRLDQLADDREVGTVILTGGQPDVFIRHFDLEELAAAADALADQPAPPDARWDSSLFHRITRKLETLPQVIIAAINGTCMGVGYEIALACDIRIAGVGDYDIGLPEMNIAMCPGGGGTVRLARLLGPATALELIATATTVSPDRAAELGLVNRVEPDALAAARNIANDLAIRSPGALAAAKRIVNRARDQDIESALTQEQREVNARLGSDEVRSRLRAMVHDRTDIRQSPGPGKARP